VPATQNDHAYCQTTKASNCSRKRRSSGVIVESNIPSKKSKQKRASKETSEVYNYLFSIYFGNSSIQFFRFFTIKCRMLYQVV
jgi:hypothetical protein